MLSEDFLKILLAIGVGGAVGLEREYRDKAAGFRTLIFICVGATLFAMLSSKLAADRDPTRIAANIVSGVGFLGAGVILRDGGRVEIETHAGPRSAWVTAGMAQPVRLRLRDLGLPARGPRRQGHLFVTLRAEEACPSPARDLLHRFETVWARPLAA